MTKRWWIFTLNNPDDDWEHLVTGLQAEFMTGQLEMGEKATPHYQFVAWFRNPIRLTTLKKRVPRAHIECVKGTPQQAIKYCTKEETRIDGPFVHGVLPFKVNSTPDWEAIWTLAKQGDFEQVPKNIALRCFTNLLRIRATYDVPVGCESVRGVWLYGAPGVGKSFYVRQTYPDVWSKTPHNKWWDGYAGQRFVVIDDLGMDHKYMGGYLKNWLDSYAVSIEIKGGVAPLKADTIIITSNYHPRQIWGDDPLLYQAIRRRLREVLWMDAQRSVTNEQD